jgi:hypothetical protein
MAITKLININSGLVNLSTEEIETNKILELEMEISGVTDSVWPRPIYMVNKDLMDIICPPELKKYYDPEKIKENIDNHKGKKKKSETIDHQDEYPWGEIFGNGLDVPAEGEIALFFQNFWGVYIHKLGSDTFQSIIDILKKKRTEDDTYYKNVMLEIASLYAKQEPFIFICPERMKPFAERLGTSGASVLGYKRDFKLVLKYVCFKCVCFHYFHPSINNTNTWTRLVSHSLATFFSLRSLEEQESKVASMFLNRGSVEDRTYECWEKLTPSKITREINIWLVKWSLGQPAISTAHDSPIYSKLHKTATKSTLQPTLNSDEYSFEFRDQYNYYLNTNNRILNDGTAFWEKIAWNLLLSWRNMS